MAMNYYNQGAYYRRRRSVFENISQGGNEPDQDLPGGGNPRPDQDLPGGGNPRPDQDLPGGGNPHPDQ